MPTSGTYAFLVTRDDIIRQALLNIGKLDAVETPTAEATRDCALLLNLLCRQWMGRSDYAPGLKVWTRRRGHLFLSGTTNTYDVGPTANGWTESYAQTTVLTSALSGATSISVSTGGATSIGVAAQKIGIELDSGTLQWTTINNISSIVSGVSNTINLNAALTGNVSPGAWIYIYTTTAQQPVKIEAAVLRDENSNDRVLAIMTQNAYDALPGKAAPATSLGDPTAIYYETQLGNSKLYTDVAAAQDVRRHIVLTYMEPVQTFNSALDNPHYPEEYFLALTWALSKQIAPMFHATWTDTMESNYQQAMLIARNKDPDMTDMYFLSGAWE